jgi:hypothetical protein
MTCLASLVRASSSLSRAAFGELSGSIFDVCRLDKTSPLWHGENIHRYSVEVVVTG